jgi:hypothetical protein
MFHYQALERLSFSNCFANQWLHTEDRIEDLAERSTMDEEEMTR